MTRQISSTVENGRTAGLALEPVRPPRNLTEEVVERLAQEISSGRLAPGSKLPTEMALMKAFGVSRTVVREAVAALKAEGKVITRQGSGAYVATDARRFPFRIEVTDLDTVAEAVSIMELRLAVEVEAAALAAERATVKDLRAIAKAQAAFAAAIEREGAAVVEDFAFHLAIAQATHNSRFTDFLTFIGHHVIPRQVVRGSLQTADLRQTYLRIISHEHEKILAAIKAANAIEARRTMRAHLTNGLERYRKLAPMERAARR